MTLTFSKPLKVWWQLLQRDLYVFRKQYIDYLINTLLWPLQASIAFGYVFPLMGMAESYGASILLASVVYKCLYESYFQSSEAVADINNLRSIDFALTLPLPAWMLLSKNIAYFIIRSMLLGVPIIAIGKLVLQDRFPLDAWAPGLALVSFLATSIFFAVFTILLAATVRNQIAFEHAWVRCFDILITWGSYWFPWYVLYKFAPAIAYVTLLNPFTLATEAIRCSFMGPAGNLPFWPCIGGLALETIIIGFTGYKMLKRRLDFVD